MYVRRIHILVLLAFTVPSTVFAADGKSREQKVAAKLLRTAFKTWQDVSLEDGKLPEDYDSRSTAEDRLEAILAQTIRRQLPDLAIEIFRGLPTDYATDKLDLSDGIETLLAEGKLNAAVSWLDTADREFNKAVAFKSTHLANGTVKHLLHAGRMDLAEQLIAKMLELADTDKEKQEVQYARSPIAIIKMIDDFESGLAYAKQHTPDRLDNLGGTIMYMLAEPVEGTSGGKLKWPNGIHNAVAMLRKLQPKPDDTLNYFLYVGFQKNAYPWGPDNPPNLTEAALILDYAIEYDLPGFVQEFFSMHAPRDGMEKYYAKSIRLLLQKTTAALDDTTFSKLKIRAQTDILTVMLLMLNENEENFLRFEKLWYGSIGKKQLPGAPPGVPFSETGRSSLSRLLRIRVAELCRKNGFDKTNEFVCKLSSPVLRAAAEQSAIQQLAIHAAKSGDQQQLAKVHQLATDALNAIKEKKRKAAVDEEDDPYRLERAFYIALSDEEDLRASFLKSASEQERKYHSKIRSSLRAPAKWVEKADIKTVAKSLLKDEGRQAVLDYAKTLKNETFREVVVGILFKQFLSPYNKEDREAMSDPEPDFAPADELIGLIEHIQKNGLHLKLKSSEPAARAIAYRDDQLNRLLELTDNGRMWKRLLIENYSARGMFKETLAGIREDAAWSKVHWKEDIEYFYKNTKVFEQITTLGNAKELLALVEEFPGPSRRDY